MMKLVEEGRVEEVLKEALLDTPSEVKQVVSEIIKDVKTRGDKALRDYTLKFDGWDIEKGFVVKRDELEEAWNSLPEKDKDALLVAKNRIEKFHKNQIERSWLIEDEAGLLGMLVRPIEKVGIYVPGGRASLPSTVLMNAVPAKIAGVKEIYAASPAPSGKRNPYILGACFIAGVEKLYLVGGAQAVAAFAFGTETVPRVDKVVGPGNIYVAEAKRQLFGIVGIDSVAGPSEILVIADETADPAWVAADLLSQAEHDVMARPILVTTSKRLAEKVMEEIEKQLKDLPTKEVAQAALKKNGFVFVVKSPDEAVFVANRIAPEHLELMVKDPWELLPKIKNAGAVFIGSFSPEPMGDYIAGPNHTLPTGSTARFLSPLGVYDFLKRTSVIALNKKGFEELAGYAERLAEIEGLFAHKKSIKMRGERGS